MSRPAKNGALDSEETSKFRTSFHAYGSMLVNAIGSATRTSAAVNRQYWKARLMAYALTYRAGKAGQQERHYCRWMECWFFAW